MISECVATSHECAICFAPKTAVVKINHCVAMLVEIPDPPVDCAKLSVEREKCSLSITILHTREWIADEPLLSKHESGGDTL